MGTTRWFPIITCVVILTIIYFNKRRKKFDSKRKLSVSKWSKLGRVSEIYMYPLMSAKGRVIKECEVTSCGILQTKPKKIKMLRDRMFIVYTRTPYQDADTSKLKTGLLKTSKEFPCLQRVNVTFSCDKVILSAPGTSKFVFKKKYIKRISKVIDCMISCCNRNSPPIECTDCGEGVAKWISEYLTDSKESLRLALCGIEQNLMNHFRACFATYKDDHKATKLEKYIHLNKLDNILIATQSLKGLNNSVSNVIGTYYFHPTIFIVTKKEIPKVDEWEYIKIGDVIIKNKIPLENVNNKKINNSLILKNFPRYLMVGLRSEVSNPGTVKMGEDVFIQYRNKIKIKKDN